MRFHTTQNSRNRIVHPIKAVLIKDGCAIFVGVSGSALLKIRIGEINEVGYMTIKANPCCHDYYYLINAGTITYEIPIEIDGVQEVIQHLEKSLLGYDSKIGLANVLQMDTLSVWPISKAGDKFSFMEKICSFTESREVPLLRRIILLSVLLIIIVLCVMQAASVVDGK